MPSFALNRLVYISRATSEATARFDATVADIVTASQRNNAAVEVTGILLASNGWFLQALEGPRRQVSTTFARIARDPRHEVFELLQAGPVDGRMFGRWTMIASSLSPKAAPLLEAMTAGDGFDASRLDASGALRLLLTVSSIADGKLERLAS
jgi:hypothetical protein